MDKKGVCVLSTGGTGGHVLPCTALATELNNVGWEVIIFTDTRGLHYLDKSSNEYSIEVINISSETASLRKKLIELSYQLPLEALRAGKLMFRKKPKFVLGFGGVSTFPILFVSVLLRIPIFIQEQNAVLGRVNRFFQRFSTKVFCHFSNTLFLDPKIGLNTGNPVRNKVLKKLNSQYLGPGPWPITVLVLGGSQGASILSKVIPDAIARLDTKIKSRLEVTQQCRPEDLNGTRAAYQSISIKAELESFFNDIPDRIANAHLLICRAGASTVSEVMTVGRPAILVPYPFAIDDHQTFNAHALDEAGGGWLMAQDNFTPDGLADRLSDLFNAPKTLRHAAECARVSGHRDAAVKLADFISDQMDKKDTGRRAA